MDFIQDLIREHREIEGSLRRFIEDSRHGHADTAALAESATFEAP